LRQLYGVSEYLTGHDITEIQGFSMTRRYALALILSASVTTAPGCSNQAPDQVALLTDSTRWRELEQVIPVVMDSAGVPGLSIAITTDSGIAWGRGFGVRSTDTGDPVDTGSVFEAASLSKPVFAYGVLQLVDQGVLDLDTPLSEYYDYADIADDPQHERITARMVLTHSTGFPNWRPGGGQLTITFEPGTEFSYSGEGFGYLQRVVMHVTGERLQPLMERLVFEPVGMPNSSYIWDDRFESDIDGNVTDKRKPQAGTGHAAATLHTTAPDFARFMTAVMNGTGLSDTVAAAMLTPQIEVDSGVTWGLGIGLQNDEVGRAFWHWGDNTNYKAYTLTYPDRGVGVVWFANSDHGQSILNSMLANTVGGLHPAAAWLDYEQYDSPSRIVREALTETYEAEGVEAAMVRYHDLKATQPADAFHENLLNSLGYQLLRSDRIDDAIAVFRLNIDEYPDAWNPYDSMGEAYMVAGQLELATEYYERSIQLNPENTGGKAALERIRAQISARD
jgi:CubicO group peptidase (beta-lactamase class C family)